MVNVQSIDDQSGSVDGGRLGVQRGPPAEARRSPAYWVLAAAALVLLAMFAHLLVTSSSSQWGVVAHYFTSSEVVSGLVRTLYLTAIAMALGIVIGTIVALMKICWSIVLSVAVSSYIWFFRGTPLKWGTKWSSWTPA